MLLDLWPSYGDCPVSVGVCLRASLVGDVALVGEVVSDCELAAAMVPDTVALAAAIVADVARTGAVVPDTVTLAAAIVGDVALTATVEDC